MGVKGKGGSIKRGVRLVVFCFKALLLALELLMWVVYYLRHAVLKGKDVVVGIRSIRSGQLRCPKGHVVPITGVWECSACSFTWEGSGLRCPNPECGALTPFLSCPCGLSIRNPYRWGRP